MDNRIRHSRLTGVDVEGRARGGAPYPVDGASVDKGLVRGWSPAELTGWLWTRARVRCSRDGLQRDIRLPGGGA